MNEALSLELQRLVLPLLQKRDTELIELNMRREGHRLVLRFLVDKPDGITLGECAQLNRGIGEILEREDTISDSYLLEVCSPGLDRPLKETRDFQRVLGRRVKVVLHQPQDKQNVYAGQLKEVDADSVVIESEQQKGLRIPRTNIARAQLEVEF